MEYKNTKTGVTFSSPCVVSGGDWVLVEKTKEPTEQEIPKVIDEEQQEEQQEQVEQEAIESKTGDEIFDSITVPQIKQELDAFGIEYNPRAKKQELYDLMMAQGE